MEPKELAKRIKDELDSGYSVSKARKELIEEGNSPSEVDKAIDIAFDLAEGHKSDYQRTDNRSNSSNLDTREEAIALGSIFLLLSTLIFLFFFVGLVIDSPFGYMPEGSFELNKTNESPNDKLSSNWRSNQGFREKNSLKVLSFKPGFSQESLVRNAPVV